MSAGARDELLEALTRFGNRVKVPLWSAKETWEWSNDKIQKFPLRSHADRLRAQIEAFSNESRRYVDDETTAELTKQEYEGSFDAAAKEILRLCTLVAGHERQPEQTSTLLMPFIDGRLLPSKLVDILARIDLEGDLRIQHRIPPGFGDARLAEAEAGGDLQQKGKKLNRYGDQIIWKEILDAAASMNIEDLVLITRDIKKGDWVYTPRRVRDTSGQLRNNDGLLTLAHPLLVQEARQHCPKLKRVHILSIASLAFLLRSYLSQPVPKLLAALQADQQPRPTRPKDTAEGSLPEDGKPLPAEITFRSADLNYEPTRDDVVDRALIQLSVDDWRVQNEAAQQLGNLLGEANRNQLVQIGRGMVQAINELAVEPLQLLQRLFVDTKGPNQRRANVLVGALAQVYLNEAGDPKKPIATPELTKLILAVHGDDALKPAFQAVLDRLQAQRRAYLWLPGDAVQTLEISLGLDRGGSIPVLRSASVGAVELLEEQAPASRRIARSGRDELIHLDEFLFRLSGEFVVPADLLRINEPSRTSVTVEATTGFVRWGPGTGVALR